MWAGVATWELFRTSATGLISKLSRRFDQVEVGAAGCPSAVVNGLQWQGLVERDASANTSTAIS